MSDEHFIARWSRRKQEAKGDHAEPAQEEPSGARGSAFSSRAAAEPIPPETELSNLPPIESIDAATDIMAFLRKGIPQELSRAALRRAWSADPAIRDFVGLAENAWDFNDPNAMPGFGPLHYSAEQVSDLVRRIVGGVVEAATDPNVVAVAEATEDAEQPEVHFTQPSEPVESRGGNTQPRDECMAAELPPTDAALPRGEISLPRRTHGKALPR